MRRRLLTAGLLAVATTVTAAAVAVAGPGRAAASTAGFTVTSGTLDVLDGPTGTHAVTLAYNLYVPDGVDAAHPAPAVLSTNGFGLSKDANELTSIDGFFASHGYVALAWTAQGFGTSGGCIQLDSADYDVKDARAFIDFLQGLPIVARDATGARIGMIGGSYGGAIDVNTAEADPRVRALVPSRTWNSLVYALDPNNAVADATAAAGGRFTHPNDAPGIFKAEWTTLFFSLGNAQPVGGLPPDGTSHGGCLQDKLTSGDPTTVAGTPCTGYYLPVCKAYADSAAGTVDGSDEAFLAAANPVTHLDRLTVPTLLTQGQSDTLFNEDDALGTYTSLRARGIPAGLLWNDGGHGGYNSQPGEGEEYDGAARTPAQMDALTIPRAQLAWMDRYLRGDTTVAVPGFSWFRDYVPNAATSTGASAYAAAPAFPVMDSTIYALSGSDALVTSGATAGSATANNLGVPSYSETSNEQGPGSPANGIPATDPPGGVATFDTPAFPADEESVGVPTAHLQISHANPAAPLQFFAKVYDVAPDGSKTLIRRLVAPVSVASPGSTVDVNLLGYAHDFAKGHRAELALAATDLAYKGSSLPDSLTIVTGPGTSTFSLPLRALTQTNAATVVTTTSTTPAKKKAATKKAAAPSAPHQPSRTLAYTGGTPLLALTGGLLLAVGLVAGRLARRRVSREPGRAP